MDANQLAELKIQIQELLDKQYIRLDTSPLGAPVILFQRKMEVHGCVYIIVYSMKLLLRISIIFLVLMICLIS